MMSVVLSGIVAFLLGSIPTAYLLVKKNHALDLRNEGSGNLGARNVYEVSGSKKLGGIVFVLDVLKGIIAVGLPRAFSDNPFLDASVACVCVVLGHNYSPWLRFKGGRGLAAALGGSVLINPILALVWALFWMAGFLKTRNTHFANIVATILTPILMIFIPNIVKYFSWIPYEFETEPIFVTVAVCLVIFTRHIGPMKTMIRNGVTPDE